MRHPALHCFVTVIVALAAAATARQQAEISVEVYLPTRLELNDIEYVKSFLTLSEAQSAILERLHATYIEEWNQTSERMVPAVRAGAIEAGGLFYGRPDGYQWDAIDAFESFESARHALLKAYRELDAGLWASIEPLLTEEQALRLARIRMQRSRDCCRLTHREIHGSRIDLMRLLRRHDVQVDPGTDLDLVMAEYDAALTGIWLALDQRLNDTETDTLRAAVELLKKRPPPAGQRSYAGHTYKERMAQLKRPILRLARRIVTLNDVFLPRIVELLSNDKRAAIESTYHAIAYPALYPDRLDPTYILDKMLDDKTLTDEQRDSLRGIWADYRRAYESINRQLERREDDWWEEFAMTRGATDLGDYRNTMQQLRSMRWQRSKAVVQHLQAALPEAAATSMQPLADDYQQQFDRLTSAAMDSNWPR